MSINSKKKIKRGKEINQHPKLGIDAFLFEIFEDDGVRFLAFADKIYFAQVK